MVEENYHDRLRASSEGKKTFPNIYSRFRLHIWVISEEPVVDFKVISKRIYIFIYVFYSDISNDLILK